ncbi:MAG: hypothetical protein H7Y61_10680 [Rhizobiales bacterium]|nr:hypothetical protein [Rhizobacter sp.]
MDADHRSRHALNTALSRLLRPLFRLLLRYGVSYGAFEELARQAFVDVAMQHAGFDGKKPSISRVSVLSGLTRKEVQRLSSPGDRGPPVDQHNRAARVLTGWVRDPDFHDAQGQPCTLAAEGTPSFALLVKRHSGDVPARAVLDELVRVGAVRLLGDGSIELLQRAYVPSRSVVEKLRILGADVADLIDTIEHNVQRGGDDPRFQRKVMYRSMPAATLAPFRKLSAKQSQALLERLDRWLAAHDLDNPPDQPDLPRARVGVGIYYFEEPIAPTPPAGDET